MFMSQDTENYSFKTDSSVSKQENHSTRTFSEEPNYRAKSTNQSDYSAYPFIRNESLTDKQSEFH